MGVLSTSSSSVDFGEFPDGGRGMRSPDVEVFSIYQAGGIADYNGTSSSPLGCSEVLTGFVSAPRNTGSTQFSLTHVWPSTKNGHAATYAALEMVVRDSAGRIVAVATFAVGDGTYPIIPAITVSAYYGQCNIYERHVGWCVEVPVDDCSLIDLASSSSWSSSSWSSSSWSSSSSSSISSTSSSSSSSSSYVKNIPTDLPSYVSTCRNATEITNPATGQTVGMTIEGDFDETSYPEDGTFVYKGGLTRTIRNGGRISCRDASGLFSMRHGMVSTTLRFPQPVLSGVYAPLAGRFSSANPDMVVFCVNPGESYTSPPGLYAALTPAGIEFTVWSLGSKVTVVDASTSLQNGTDAVLTFAWDFQRRISCGGHGQSVAIFVNGVPTAYSSGPVNPSGFEHLFQVEVESQSSEEWETARFFFGDSPSGKNGLVGIAVRRIEIYKEPCGIPMSSKDGYGGIAAVSLHKSEAELGFSVDSARWVSVGVLEPEFKAADVIQVNLTETNYGQGTMNGLDLGAVEDDSYPPIPNGIPPGITEARAKQ